MDDGGYDRKLLMRRMRGDSPRARPLRRRDQPREPRAPVCRECQRLCRQLRRSQCEPARPVRVPAACEALVAVAGGRRGRRPNRGKSAVAAGLLLIALTSRGANEGRHPVTLTDLESLGFPDVTLQLSPDRGWLAYALGSDSVRLVRARRGAVPRQIGTGFLPTWSPAGDKVAFYSLESGDVQLW